jgi:hypothetical protein
MSPRSTAPLQTCAIRLIANHAIQRWFWIVQGAFATVQTHGVGNLATQFTPQASEDTKNSATLCSRKSTNGKLSDNVLRSTTAGSRLCKLIATAHLVERGFCCKSWHVHFMDLPFILGSSSFAGLVCELCCGSPTTCRVHGLIRVTIRVTTKRTSASVMFRM